MERLTFTDLKTSNNKLNMIKELLLAATISIGNFLCLDDLFGFSYTLKNAVSGGIIGGLVRTWNMIVDALGNSDYILLPHFAGQTDENGLFLSICIIITIIVAYLIIKSRASAGLLIFVIPVVVFNLFFELDLQSGSVAWLILSILCTLMYIKSQGEGFVQNILLVGIIGVIIASLFRIPGFENFANKPSFVRNTGEAVTELISNAYYGENPLHSGDLSQRERDKESGEALEVTMENPHSMYLRGFIGDIYTGESWESLSNAAYYDVSNQMKWFDKSGFNAIGQLGQASELSGKTKDTGMVTVKAKDADKRYTYIPYEIQSFEGEKKPVIKGGNFVANHGLKKSKEYTYQAGENAVKSWTETAGSIFTEADKVLEKEEKLTQYFIDESYYNVFVYAAFTYLSGEDKMLLNENIGESGDQRKGHIDYKVAINKVKNYLKDNFIYTENLGKKSEEGGSTLNEFLTNKKGYDVQYATAATLMFRYYGIPARYVEGYMITPEDVKEIKENETIKVDRENAHAWVEIYIDGVGFVPIEVCPEYEGVMESADLNIGISNNTLLKQFESPENNEQDDGYLEDEKDSKKHIDWKKVILLGIFSIMAGMLLIYLLLNLIKLLMIMARKRRMFYKTEPKIAISAIYGYMKQKTYPISEDVRKLGNKAAYSQEDVTEEERKLMLTKLKEAKKEYKRGKKIEKK